MKRYKSPGYSQGISLIELLVSMVIAMLVLAGVINSYLASRTAFRFNEELAYIQENARYAVEYLSREIRGAGYFGCDQRNALFANTVNGDLGGYLGLTGLTGYEGGASTFPDDFDDEVQGNTDAVIVRQGSESDRYAVVSHAGQTFTLASSHSFNAGTVFLVSDSSCRHQGMFVMSGPSGSGLKTTLEHNTGGGTLVENCTTSLQSMSTDESCANASTCTTAATCPYSSATYGIDSTIMRMTSTAFYIGESVADPTVRALFVSALGNPGEELVSGIEDFQITYGLDSSGNGQPNRYVAADNVGAANWNNIVAVRIQMVMRSRNPVLEQAEARTFLNVNYNDRFLRQLITTTIRVRNYVG